MQPQIARFLASLSQTERLPREQLVAYQRRLLERLVRHARAESSFYADRLTPLFRADDSIDWDRWVDLPILTRREAQAHTKELAAAHIPDVMGDRIDVETTGSTGESWRYTDTAMHAQAIACANERFYRWHDIAPDLLCASLTGHADSDRYPQGRRATGWRPAHPKSPAAYLHYTTPHHQQVEWLARTRPGIIKGFPSNIRELLRLAESDLQALGPLRTVTFGERLEEETRTAITDTFGHAPVDFYGASEGGFVAGQCPESGGYHITSELVLVELVDDDGTPVPLGAEGRVIVTPFYNYATPLIRYDLGDHAVMATEHCTCGRTLPIMKRILGRTRNVFRFADGTSVWPSLPSDTTRPFVPHRQFQVVQTAPNHIEFRFVPPDGEEASVNQEGLERVVREKLHEGLRVTPIAVADINRPGKNEDYVRTF